MNGNDRKSDCEHFEILISCSLDGELRNDEQMELSQHLEDCTSCRQRSLNFSAVNDLAGRLGVVESVQQTKMVVPSSAETQDGKRARNWLSYVPYAALVGLAAALMIWLGALLPSTQRADAAEIVAPLVSLVQINTTRQEDQEFFRESLELDMRTLRLQIESLDDPEHRDEMKQQYELLLKRIKEI